MGSHEHSSSLHPRLDTLQWLRKAVNVDYLGQ